jgi:hypothetical protein
MHINIRIKSIKHSCSGVFLGFKNRSRPSPSSSIALDCLIDGSVQSQNLLLLSSCSFTLMKMRSIHRATIQSLHTLFAILLSLVYLVATTPTATITVPTSLTSFPTTVTRTKWTSYSTSTEYPNPGLPLFSEQQWVDTTMVAVYDPWLSAPTSFPYTLVRISETTAMNEVRVTSEWNKPAITISLLSNAWTVKQTLTI